MARELQSCWTWESALENATEVWRDDLKNMLLDAKSRFGDVCWEVMEDDSRDQCREIWAHKAIIYARASPGFHLRHFSNKTSRAERTPRRSLKNTPHHERSNNEDISITFPRYSTPFRYTVFVEELLNIYTAKGRLGDLERPNHNKEHQKLRTNQLREDLLSMRCTGLYSDVRIIVGGKKHISSNVDGEAETPIFYAHSFILISRSTYFRSILHTTNRKIELDEGSTTEITLPSPRFHPASFKWIIRFIYAGTLPLPFPNTTSNRRTTFDIWYGALFLGIKILPDLMARQMTTMLHGLCLLDLDDLEYAKVVGDTWSGMVRTPGVCLCRKCQEWFPRVLKLSLTFETKGSTVGNTRRGAIRGLLITFGPGWCTPQFAALPSDMKDYLFARLKMFLREPVNVLPILFAVERALDKIDALASLPPLPRWLESIKTMFLQARDFIDIIFCQQTSRCLKCTEWHDLVMHDALGKYFGTQKKLRIIGSAIMRGVRSTGPVEVYKAIDANRPGTIKEKYFSATPLETFLRLLEADVHELMVLEALDSIPDSRAYLEALFLSLRRVSYSTSSGSQIAVEHVGQSYSPILSAQDKSSSMVNSSRTSYHSALSTFNPAEPMSAAETEESLRNPVNDALDLASLSSYSYASSRTQSTDYGLYYTRRAYSQDSIEMMTLPGRGRRWSVTSKEMGTSDNRA